MLSHLENFTRQNILALWDPPFIRSEPPTQETVAAEEGESVGSAADALTRVARARYGRNR